MIMKQLLHSIATEFRKATIKLWNHSCWNIYPQYSVQLSKQKQVVNLSNKNNHKECSW